MTSTNQAINFIQALSDDDFRARVTPALWGLSPGDWGGVVAIASGEGYAFTIDEIKAATPPEFFRGAGARVDEGWRRESLD